MTVWEYSPLANSFLLSCGKDLYPGLSVSRQSSILLRRIWRSQSFTSNRPSLDLDLLSRTAHLGAAISVEPARKTIESKRVNSGFNFRFMGSADRV